MRSAERISQGGVATPATVPSMAEMRARYAVTALGPKRFAQADPARSAERLSGTAVPLLATAPSIVRQRQRADVTFRLYAPTLPFESTGSRLEVVATCGLLLRSAAPGDRRNIARFTEDVQKSINAGETVSCGICSQPIVDEFHIDHKLPVSQGGTHDRDNLQPSHPFCNLSKNRSVVFAT